MTKLKDNEIYDMFIDNLNNLLIHPTISSVRSLFHEDGYIRLNMLYLSPGTICSLKNKLDQMELRLWEITSSTMIFEFIDFRITFTGPVSIFGTDHIFCIEQDFVPDVTYEGCETLYEIERFLKACDALFFMEYPIHIDNEILNNPLSQSVPFLSRNIDDDN